MDMGSNWVGTYMLDERGEPMPVPTIPWGLWFETSGQQRLVARNMVGLKVISTIFLGLDHDFLGIDDPLTYRPILWETAIFWEGGESKSECVSIAKRYRSKQEALEGHQAVVEEEMRKYAREHAAASERGF
jgi:hypothetical protein